MLGVWLATLNVLDDCFQISIHKIPARILVHSVLGHSMRSRSDARRFDVVRYYVFVELLGNELHPELLLVAQEADDLVENVERFR